MAKSKRPASGSQSPVMHGAPAAPEGNVADVQLADIIDVEALQSLMNDFYELTQVPMAIIDMNGKVLVGVGWQQICTAFHRVNPVTCRYCIESDLELTSGIDESQYKLYKCKNNMWDAAAPLIVGGRKMGNLFTGQFFFDDETPDYDLFRAQAKEYGFDEAAYMAALEKVHRLSRAQFRQAMSFLHGMAKMISQTSYVNLRLSRLLEQQKRAEEALRQSQLDLGRAQAVGSMGSWRLDVRNNRLAWSDETYRIFGISKQTPLTYEVFLSTIHPEDRAAVDAAWQAALTGADYSIEHRAVVNGQVKWVREKAYLEFDEGGELIGGFGITQDITYRKQIEEDLRRLNETLEHRVELRTAQLNEATETATAERQQLYNVLETLPVYVCLLTPDYRMPFANRKFREWFGYDGAKTCYQFLFNRSEPCDDCQTYSVLKTDAPHQWEWTGPNERTYSVFDFPFNDTDGSRLILEMGIDVTEWRQAQKSLTELNETLEHRIDQRTAELRQSQEDLRTLNESLEQRVIERTLEVQRQADRLRALANQLSQSEQRERKRLSKILHDHIQQLIVAAKLQLSWMKNDQDPKRQATVQAVDAILKETLEASRSLTIDLSPPVLQQAGLTGGLSWLAERMKEKNGFTVRLSADNDAEPAAEETRFLLFECARELLFNALKHAGVSEAQVILSRTNCDCIQLIVSDRGKGFNLERLNNRRSDEVTFGLFSIRERLAHIGGQMDIDTAPGRGSRFTLTVTAGPPKQVQAAASAHRRRRRNEADAGQSATRLCRVLVCDDHKIVREGLAKLLQFESGFEVAGQAATGMEAVELAAQCSPDVIIMDVNLPDISGVETTRRILQANPAVKVIGLSMHEDYDVARAMRDAGAVTYLTKTGPSEDLIAAIRACM